MLPLATLVDRVWGCSCRISLCHGYTNVAQVVVLAASSPTSDNSLDTYRSTYPFHASSVWFEHSGNVYRCFRPSKR